MAAAITSGKGDMAGSEILGQTYFVRVSEQGFKLNINNGYIT